MEIEELAKSMLEDSRRWFGIDVASNLTHMGFGICGEAGEVAEILKKIIRGSRQWDPETQKELVVELIDVLIYVLSTLALLNAPIMDIYNQKREFNERRFGPSKSNDGAV